MYVRIYAYNDKSYCKQSYALGWVYVLAMNRVAFSARTVVKLYLVFHVNLARVVNKITRREKYHRCRI